MGGWDCLSLLAVWLCGGVCTCQIAKQVYAPRARRLRLMSLYSSHLLQYFLKDNENDELYCSLLFVCVCGEREYFSCPLCFPSMCNIYTMLLWDDCWGCRNSNRQLLSLHITIYNLCIEIVHYWKSKWQASLSSLNSYVLICHHHTALMIEVCNIVV